MTQPSAGSSIERIRRAMGRTGFVLAVGALALGAGSFAAGQAGPASYLFRIAVAVLIAMPVRNLIALLLEETASQDWIFVGLAAASLTMLVYAVVDRLR